MPKARQDQLNEIASDGRFDVIVVGGGVNGVGVFRELSLQGLRVLLVERNDFCSGCSAAPSRMIHGGLRYLENGEFGLVRESLEERDALLRNAPHMVRPLPTLIPITSVYSGSLNAFSKFLGKSGKPSNRGALPIKLGLSLYDWVTRKHRQLPKHKFQTREETFRKWPGLTQDVRSSAVYFDAWISHPERLCMEMIADATAATPACVALNYAELRVSNGAYSVVCIKTGRQLPIEARSVVNASGAWIDETARALGGMENGQMVGGTKGSHLILDNADLAAGLGGHMVYFENTDGRVCIVFPYLGRVLAGSTDIRVPGAARVRCEDEEMDYILGSLQRVFPEIPVSREDVVFSYSGIRPLPYSDQNFTGRISRSHSVRRLDGPVPQFCMVGGKWTTFRAFAEQATDAVLAELNADRRVGTADLPIGGGKDWPEDVAELEAALKKTFGVSADRARHLADHYGTGAAKVQKFCAEHGPDMPLNRDTHYTTSEILYLVRNEHVETLSDVVLRRTSLAITGTVSIALIDAVAQIMSAERPLSPSDIAAQRSELIAELGTYFGVSEGVLTQRSKERSMECA